MTLRRYLPPPAYLVYGVVGLSLLTAIALLSVALSPLPYDDGGYCDLTSTGVQRPCR